MRSLPLFCTLWHRRLFQRRLKKWTLGLSLGKAEGLQWVKKCLGVRTWGSSPSLSHPPSMFMIDINLSRLLWCQQNHFIWAAARRTVADSPPVVTSPPSSSSEFRKTLHRVAVCLLEHRSSPCLISCFLPGACISDSSKLFTGVTTKACVIQDINLTYWSNQTSPPDTMYALQIQTQIKGWILIIPTHPFF